MSLTRRIFLKNSAMAMVATAAVPAFLARAVYGAETAGSKKKLVVIFQRGAADGLNVIVPHGEAAYYSMRPTIAIPRPSRAQESCIDLDGFFGMHPSLAPLKPLWDERHLALVHASGSPDTTRSHFDAQDYMESGTPGVKSTEDGWLNRCMQAEGDDAATPFRAVALGSSLPRILSGGAPAVAIDNVRNFAVGGGGPAAAPISSDFEAMYAQSVDAVLHGTGHETFEAVKMLKSADPNRYQPAAGANYPRGRFGDALRQTAQLLKANLGVEVAFTDIGGWDHHVNEGSTQGQLANLLREFSQSLAAFWIDLGPIAEDTVAVTMSEFGRTARENGNRGTDHGHANVMFVLGGSVRGGKVYGRWPGMNEGQLYEGRDLAVTTDFRRVLGEAVARHLGNRQLDAVFPGFDNSQQRFLKLLG
jgi:uncharacterized protein (DUF1501 family)